MSDSPTRRASDFVPPKGIPWAQIGVVIGVLVFLGTIVTFLTGGIHPQWASDITKLQDLTTTQHADILNLQQENAALKADLKIALAASASDRAALSARIEADSKLFTSRLDAMWRPEDYTARDSHLSRLDTVFEALRDRVTKLEYDDQRLTDKFQQLTTVPAARSK